MIASALRTEIEGFYIRASAVIGHADLVRCAVGAQRLTRGMRVGASEEQLPSMRALKTLVEGGADEQQAAQLAYRALCEYMAARLGLDSGNPDRVEAALDALDGLVQDPADLPALRARLRVFTEHFEHLCKEATDARRRHSNLRISAA